MVQEKGKFYLNLKRRNKLVHHSGINQPVKQAGRIASGDQVEAGPPAKGD